MCGLAGVYSDGYISKPEFETFRVLSLLAALRGVDSSGVMIGHGAFKRGRVNNPHIRWLRSMTTLPELVYNDEGFLRSTLGNLYSQNDRLRYLISHGRAATLGGINLENCHPHAIEKQIIGVHNGTISAFGSKDSSDSAELFKNIHRHGLIKTVELAGQSGAMAIFYVDMRDNSLNVYRNSMRTLYSGRSGNTIFWSSEEWMLEQASKRSDTSTISDIKLVPPNVWYKIPLSGQGKPIETKVDVFTTVSRVPNVPVPSKPMSRKSIMEDSALTQPTKVDDEKGEAEDGPAGPLYQGYSGLITEAEVTAHLSRGCAYCEGEVDTDGVINWITKDSALCKPCAQDKDVRFLVNPANIRQGGRLSS